MVGVIPLRPIRSRRPSITADRTLFQLSRTRNKRIQKKKYSERWNDVRRVSFLLREQDIDRIVVLRNGVLVAIRIALWGGRNCSGMSEHDPDGVECDREEMVGKKTERVLYCRDVN